MSDINDVHLTGNLVCDPELLDTPAGEPVCNLRIASNSKQPNGATGLIEERCDYFEVQIPGAGARSAAEGMCKGHAVLVNGHLEWERLETDEGEEHEEVFVVARAVRHLGNPHEI